MQSHNFRIREVDNFIGVVDKSDILACLTCVPDGADDVTIFFTLKATSELLYKVVFSNLLVLAQTTNRNSRMLSRAHLGEAERWQVGLFFLH
jgi:hypothetical protein